MTALPIHALIALGSNLGNRGLTIVSAVTSLGSLPQSVLLRASSLLETDPVGPIAQPPYLNAAALISTALSPQDLLKHLLDIEQAHGRDRTREQRWGPRTLDLDLILYGDHVIDEPGLTIPHPRMHQRRFVLAPASEIAGDMLVPTMNATIAELFARPLKES